MTTAETDIIDLTENMSEMRTPTPRISSAQKRLRRESLSERPSRNEKRKKHSSVVGEPFASSGSQKHYKAIHFKDMLIEVSGIANNIRRRLTSGRFDGDFGSRVRPSHTCTKELIIRQALVRRIVERRSGPDNAKEFVCHVHWLQESACGIKGELFLKHGDCQNIKLHTIKSLNPIHIGTRGPIAERPLLR